MPDEFPPTIVLRSNRDEPEQSFNDRVDALAGDSAMTKIIVFNLKNNGGDHLLGFLETHNVNPAEIRKLYQDFELNAAAMAAAVDSGELKEALEKLRLKPE